MKNLVELLDKSAKKANNTKVTITIRDAKNVILVEQKILLSDFKGGTKEFARIVNSITLRWFDEPLTITVNTIELQFLGGKFANNTKKIVRCYVDSKVLFKTENVSEIKKEFRTQVYNFFDTKCDNILEVIDLIKFVEKTPAKVLANVVANTNFLIEAKSEA